MAISLWNGSLKIPIKFFYLLLVVIIVSFLIFCQDIRYEEAIQSKSCLKVGPEKIGTGRESTTGVPHPGCWKDPIYHKWKTCLHCFRQMARNFSNNLKQVPDNILRMPRGPPNFWTPQKKKYASILRKVLLAPNLVCVETCPYLVALQPSVFGHLEERNTVRSTWGSVARTKMWPHAQMKVNIQLIFVLAHNSPQNQAKWSVPDDPTRSWVQSEADRYGDVLFLDMVDSYRNLSMKMLTALSWASEYCPRTKFFLKVDTDTFINVPLLLDILIYNEVLLEYAALGYIYYDNRPVFRIGRWRVSKEEYKLHIWPVYASGCAYVISHAALARMLEVSPYFPISSMEDAFTTGVLGRAVGIQYFPYSESLRTYFTEWANTNWDWCSFLNDTIISGTGFTKKFKMMTLWSGFVLNDWVCKTRNFVQMMCRCYEEFPKKRGNQTMKFRLP